jgi:4-hydroxyacetophenone monooxygenase
MPTMVTHELLERALAEAHLPSLIVTMAQLTGRMDLLPETWRPRYMPYTDQRDGGLTGAQQAELAEIVRELLPQLIGRRPSAAAADPPHGVLRSLMDFVAGMEIPQRYVPLLEEELGLDRGATAAKSASRAGATGLRVLVVGAGMSGLLAGIKLKQAGYDFEIIERSGDVSGTWHTNTYPGCRVDSQNHLYSYSFFPNHDWPHHFSTQDALKGYFRAAADAFGLWDHIRLETTLIDARYEAASGLWHARLLTASGEERAVSINAIISAVGQLNSPNIPEITGQDIFNGAQFHSATWRHDVDLADKSVAVVGTGASAFQLIPEVAAKAGRVTIFQRTAPWVSPTPDYHMEVGEGQKWLFKELPFYANWYRFWLFWMMTEGAMPALRIDPEWDAGDGSISALNQGIRNVLVERMRQQVGSRMDLLEKVIPKSPLGGKRTLRDNGLWIETLKRANVELVTTKIRETTADAVVTEDGAAYPADMIIYGTGFHASRFLQSTRIFGREGIELNEMWAGDPRAYLGITVPGFPNFFCIYGPNTNLVAQGSIVFMSECAVRYIVSALDLLQERGAVTLEPKPGVNNAYNARVDEENARMAWGMPGVTNWYKSASGRVSQNWPFPLVDYWKVTHKPDPADFIFDQRRIRQPAI